MRRILRRQLYHALAFFAFGGALYYAITCMPDAGTPARMWGLSATEWIYVSWLCAGGHHAWVVLFWRLEFHCHAISRLMGRAGWTVFRIGFVVLATARLPPIVPISFLTAGTWYVPQHAFVWCHYYFTEKPDMVLIYDRAADAA